MRKVTDDMNDGIIAGMNDMLGGRSYEPGVAVCVENAGYLDGYNYGWNVAFKASQEHPYMVRFRAGSGYPYQVSCPCLWESWRYASAQRAHAVGEEHVLAVAMDMVNAARRATV